MAVCLVCGVGQHKENIWTNVWVVVTQDGLVVEPEDDSIFSDRRKYPMHLSCNSLLALSGYDLKYKSIGSGVILGPKKSPFDSFWLESPTFNQNNKRRILDCLNPAFEKNL